MSITLRKLEALQEKHKVLDRQCTDVEKKLTRPVGELRELKKEKLAVKDQINYIKAQLESEKT